jgi:hypothetical protein
MWVSPSPSAHAPSHAHLEHLSAAALHLVGRLGALVVHAPQLGGAELEHAHAPEIHARSGTRATPWAHGLAVAPQLDVAHVCCASCRRAERGAALGASLGRATSRAIGDYSCRQGKRGRAGQAAGLTCRSRPWRTARRRWISAAAQRRTAAHASGPPRLSLNLSRKPRGPWPAQPRVRLPADCPGTSRCPQLAPLAPHPRPAPHAAPRPRPAPLSTWPWPWPLPGRTGPCPAWSSKTAARPRAGRSCCHTSTRSGLRTRRRGQASPNVATRGSSASSAARARDRAHYTSCQATAPGPSANDSTHAFMHCWAGDVGRRVTPRESVDTTTS